MFFFYDIDYWHTEHKKNKSKNINHIRRESESEIETTHKDLKVLRNIN